MPLQNRVTPWGEIVADPARGTLMGNRGGRIHDPQTKTLGRRRWASRAWICCVLEFRGRHHEAMGEGYTSLFFLDEVTALAAGHRPCFECRRKAAQAFFACLDEPLRAGAFDRLVHSDRLDQDRRKRTFRASLGELPDGAMVVLTGNACAIRGDCLLEWQPSGYARALPRSGNTEVDVLTPAIIVGILRRGYTPLWHESAGRLIGE